MAARFERRDELLGYLPRLNEIGINSTSRWLTDEPDIENANPTMRDMYRTIWSANDVDDVLAADTFLCFSENLTEPTAVAPDWQGVAKVGFGHDTPGFGEARLMVPALWARGGRHVEFGIAVATNKKIVVIGPRENIFHWLPPVQQFDTFDDWLYFEKGNQ